METVAVAPTPTPTTHQTMNNDTTTTLAQQKNNRIQVSNTKKPLFFYVNLAKVPLFPYWLFLLLFIFFF